MEPQYNYQQMEPQYNYQPAARNTQPQPNLLVFGILGLAIGMICGIIFGAIGRAKGNAYIRQGGTLTGASKVGFILSKIALILGIVVTAIFTVLLIIGLATGDGFMMEIFEDLIDELF